MRVPASPASRAKAAASYTPTPRSPAVPHPTPQRAPSALPPRTPRHALQRARLQALASPAVSLACATPRGATGPTPSAPGTAFGPLFAPLSPGVGHVATPARPRQDVGTLADRMMRASSVCASSSHARATPQASHAAVAASPSGWLGSAVQRPATPVTPSSLGAASKYLQSGAGCAWPAAAATRTLQTGDAEMGHLAAWDRASGCGARRLAEMHTPSDARAQRQLDFKRYAPAPGAKTGPAADWRSKVVEHPVRFCASKRPVPL